MSGRDADSIMLESDYLRLELRDLLELHSAIADAAKALAPIHVELLELLDGADARVRDAALRASSTALATMQHIERAQEAAMHLTELIGGRSKAMQAEAEELTS